MHKLCALDDLKNPSSKGFNIGEEAIFAVRQDAHVYVYRNQCPHLGIALEWLPDRFLDIDGELIQCSTHGALFTIDDGLCVSGPCSGQSLIALHTQIIDDDVWIELNQPSASS
ncbi:MAG: Rieske (2Fe-2S) protein [Cellvibrionaceae bacterium]